jgi:hypothetical protein
MAKLPHTSAEMKVFSLVVRQQELAAGERDTTQCWHRAGTEDEGILRLKTAETPVVSLQGA